MHQFHPSHSFSWRVQARGLPGRGALVRLALLARLVRMSFWLACAWVLAACSSTLTLPPQASVALPAAFKHVPLTPLRTSRSLQTPSGWWGELQDPALNIWMNVALTRNRDLVRSALRLQQASLMAGRAELDAWPKVSANLGTSAQQSLAPALRSAAGMVTGRSAPAQNNSGTPGTTGTSGSLSTGATGGLSGSYDVDLWGRVSQNTALAQQDAALARADLLAARWLLTTQVAEQYWTLAAIDAKAPLLARAAQDARATLAATQLRLSVGKARLTDEHKALAALGDAQQRLQALGLQRDNAVRTMALLFDDAPQDFKLAQASLPEQLPPEPADWPVASVLDRIPAVQRARIALDQSLTKLKIAQSNRYPQLSLSVGLSGNGSQWRQLLSSPLGSLGLGLALPMFDWKRLGLEQSSARLGLEVSAMDFRDALFKALAEVDAQYNLRLQWLAEAQLQQEKTSHAQAALVVAQLRYAQGAEPLQSVRDAQASLRELQLFALDTRLKAWLNQVAIYKAWGGPLEGSLGAVPAPSAALK